nr:hypothetical protein CFP56_36556 [Quercus suber]
MKGRTLTWWFNFAKMWRVDHKRNSWLHVGCGEMPDQVKSSVELPFNNLVPNQAQQVEVQSQPGVAMRDRIDDIFQVERIEAMAMEVRL